MFHMCNSVQQTCFIQKNAQTRIVEVARLLQACSRHNNCVRPGVPEPECGLEECDSGGHGAGLHVCRLLAPHRRHLHHHTCHPGHLQAVWPVLQVTHLALHLYLVTLSS